MTTRAKQGLALKGPAHEIQENAMQLHKGEILTNSSAAQQVTR